MNDLPIDQVLPDLLAALRSHPAVVLQAPPGAGKTTRVPLALLDRLPPEQGRIVMLEPRRIAAVSAARWMARLLGEEPGGAVGYAIRFDSRSGSRTRIEVVTEGILTRRIQADPTLAGTALVIFDEFHERSIHADLALALCLDARKALRPDLKLLVMSATLDAGPIAELLGGAPVVAASGRSFPVEERYLGDRQAPLAPRLAAAVASALRETNGDLLVFLPGAAEIRAAAQELKQAMDLREERLDLHPLYGDLPFEEQERAILPSPDHRKIVLATNIAETSLTIQGVRVVLDSGLTRLLRYDPGTGMNRLVTAPVSRAAAEQRKGRAGRLGPGVCYRLYSSQTHQAMVPYAQPEVLAADLAPLVLELAVWGVKDPGQLAWLDPPPQAAWASAVALLQQLDALDATAAATAEGREMVRLPLHPRLARLLLRSRELGCLRLGADLAALLTERDLFRPSGEDRTPRSPDLAERLDALRSGRGGIRTAGADPSALRAAERTATQLLRLLPGPQGRLDADPVRVAQLLLAAFPDRICMRRSGPGQGFVHMQGRGVRISRESHLQTSPFLIALQVDAGEKAEGFIHLAAPLGEELVRSECRERITVARRVAWDAAEGRVDAAREERLGALVLSRQRMTPADGEVAPILCDAVSSQPGLLRFDREARQLQGRVSLLRAAYPEEDWPDLADQALFREPAAWLTPWLSGVRTAADLGRIDLLRALRSRLTRQQQRMLEERTPGTVAAPSGSRIRLEYAADGPPVLAVKLQELFGLAETPRICEGRVQVLLHLLSPAGRPVQITRDLRNFWDTVYPEVKKDLKGRYPRHPWPDDPWNAAPTKRTKQRREKDR